MELKLPSTAGVRPPKKKMMFLPKVSSCLRLPFRKPSPTPASSSSEPIPQAIPNIVRKDRSLCAHRVRKVCAKVSSSMRMSPPQGRRGERPGCRPAPLILRLAEAASVSGEFVRGFPLCSPVLPVVKILARVSRTIDTQQQKLFRLSVVLLVRGHFPRDLPQHSQPYLGVIGVQLHAPDQAPQLFLGRHCSWLDVSAVVEDLKHRLRQPLQFARRRGSLLFFSGPSFCRSCRCLAPAHQFVQADCHRLP